VAYSRRAGGFQERGKGEVSALGGKRGVVLSQKKGEGARNPQRRGKKARLRERGRWTQKSLKLMGCSGREEGRVQKLKKRKGGESPYCLSGRGGRGQSKS